MFEHIQAENKDTMQFIKDNSKRISRAGNNVELCKMIDIKSPRGEHQNLHDYNSKGIQVYVYK